jgi:hypothetical protein
MKELSDLLVVVFIIPPERNKTNNSTDAAQ